MWWLRWFLSVSDRNQIDRINYTRRDGKIERRKFNPEGFELWSSNCSKYLPSERTFKRKHAKATIDRRNRSAGAGHWSAQELDEEPNQTEVFFFLTVQLDFHT